MKFGNAVLLLLPLMAAESAQVSHGPRRRDGGQRSNLRKLTDPTESTNPTESSIGATEASVKSKTVNPTESGITGTEAPCTETEPVCMCHVGKSVPDFHTEDICVGDTIRSNSQWRGVLGACGDMKLTCGEICGSDMYTCVHDMNNHEIGYCIPANEAEAADSPTAPTKSATTESTTTESVATESVATESGATESAAMDGSGAITCKALGNSGKFKDAGPGVGELPGSCEDNCNKGNICHFFGCLKDESDGEEDVKYKCSTGSPKSVVGTESIGSTVSPMPMCKILGNQKNEKFKDVGPGEGDWEGTCEYNCEEENICLDGACVMSMDEDDDDYTWECMYGTTTESAASPSGTTGSPENLGSAAVEPLVEKCRIWYNKDGTIEKFKTKEGEPDENMVDKMKELRGSCAELCDTDMICGGMMCGEKPDESGETMGVCYDPNETPTADTASTGAPESGASATPEVCCCHVGRNGKMNTKCKANMDSCMKAGPEFQPYEKKCEENIAVWENPTVGDLGLQDVCGVSHVCRCWVEKEVHDLEYDDEYPQFICHSDCPDTGSITADKGKKGKKLRL